jgi:hypothetical protein
MSSQVLTQNGLANYSLFKTYITDGHWRYMDSTRMRSILSEMVRNGKYSQVEIDKIMDTIKQIDAKTHEDLPQSDGV